MDGSAYFLHARNRIRAVLVMVGLVGALTGSLIAAERARGDTWEFYCDPNGAGVLVAGGQHCDGPRHTLLWNEADNYQGAGYRVCAGGLDTSGTFLGYICGSGYARVNYCRCELITPRIHNGETFYQRMYGNDWW